MKIVIGLAFVSLVGCGISEGTSTASLTQPPGQCGSLETHVFGIHDAPQGRVTLHIARPGNHAIVVSAHDATTWQITAGPGVTLDGIYGVGVGAQKIIGPEGVKVVTESKAEDGPYACGYAWPKSGADCDTEQLINLVEKRVHDVTSFHGCFTASDWTLADNLGVVGDCSSYEGASQTDYVQNCDGEDSCGGGLGPVFL